MKTFLNTLLMSVAIDVFRIQGFFAIHLTATFFLKHSSEHWHHQHWWLWQHHSASEWRQEDLQRDWRLHESKVCVCVSPAPPPSHTHTHISLCLTVWVHNAHSSSELCIMIDIFSSTFFLSKLRVTQTWCTYTVWLPGLWNVVFPVTWWYECEASAWASGVL